MGPSKTPSRASESFQAQNHERGAAAPAGARRDGLTLHRWPAAGPAGPAGPSAAGPAGVTNTLLATNFRAKNNYWRGARMQKPLMRPWVREVHA